MQPKKPTGGKRSVKPPSVKFPGIKPRPRYTGSLTYYKDYVDSRNYSFQETDKWVYRDYPPGIEKAMEAELSVTNALPLRVKYLLHLVLGDAEGRARFVVGYKFINGHLNVGILQRVRSKYPRYGNKFYWPSDLEKEKSKEFQGLLGGMHPAEFLLCELLHRNRENIIKNIVRGGVGVELDEKVAEQEKTIYGPIIGRFFRRVKARRPPSVHWRPNEEILKPYYRIVLATGKERVRKLLGL